MGSLDVPEIPRVKTCFFGVSLHVGTQLFAFVCMMNSLKVLSVLWSISLFGPLDCVARPAGCRFFLIYMMIKTVHVTVTAFLLFSIYTTSHLKFISVWVWYTLLESFITYFWRVVFQSIEPDPTWAFVFQFVWNLYGCLVVYSYYKHLSKGDESSGVAGI